MGLFGSSNADVAARLARVERKLDALLASLGIDGAACAGAGDPALDDVRALVAGGRKIEAIKRYREITGVGLKEAKVAVDAM
ncbi:MAG: ribosomal protein L7/L12 [Phycisphaerales bacterium]